MLFLKENFHYDIKTSTSFSSDEIHKQNDTSETLIKIMSIFPQQIKALYKFSLSEVCDLLGNENLLIELFISSTIADSSYEMASSHVFVRFSI